MIHFFKSAWDKFRGAGESALSIASLDGAFKPNQTLEESPVRAKVNRPDNLARAGDRVFFSSGSQVLELGADGFKVVEDRDGMVTALAGSVDGTLAVARTGQGLTFPIDPHGRSKGRTIQPFGGGDITAMTFVGNDEVACTIGAEGRTSSEWKHDLMFHGASGSVWLCPLRGEPKKIIGGLQYPWGIVALEDQKYLVSEAWACRFVLVSGNGTKEMILSNLPGYPSRMARASDGGIWFSLIAPRNQIVELVLREAEFRDRMVEEIDPEYWVAPMLRPTDGPLDPMLRGVQRVSGSEPNPWGSSLSFGFVGQLTSDFLPERSFHSRANGKRHGISSVLEYDGQVLSTSACGFLISIPVDIS